MEIHFPHITNGVNKTRKRRSFITRKRLITTTVAVALCSTAVVVLAAYSTV